MIILLRSWGYTKRKLVDFSRTIKLGRPPLALVPLEEGAVRRLRTPPSQAHGKGLDTAIKTTPKPSPNPPKSLSVGCFWGGFCEVLEWF